LLKDPDFKRKLFIHPHHRHRNPMQRPNRPVFFSLSTLAFLAAGGPLALFDCLWWGFGLLTGLYFDSGAPSSGVFWKLDHYKNNILLSILDFNSHIFLFNASTFYKIT
jgi:hypothetical protein